jgi:thiamine transport system permease protein
MQDRASRLRRVLRLAALSVPLVFLLVFFLYPLAAILVRSIQLSGLPARPSISYVARLLWFTFWQAAVSTILTLALGLPGAHILARYRFPAKPLLEALTTIPFVLPTLIVATAFLALIGPNGIVNTALMVSLGSSEPPLDLQHTIWVILLAHVFYNYSVVVRIVATFWANLDPSLEEAARALGASRWQAWVEVTLPLLLPSVAAAGSLTFLFCFTSFGVMIVLGGPRFATVEVEIYRQAVQQLNLPRAALLSVIQLLITFAVMSAYTRLQRQISRPLAARSRQTTQRRPGTQRARLWVGTNVLLMTGLLVLPLLALLWRSFTLGGALTLRYYRALSRDPGRSVFYAAPTTAIRNSLLFAAAAVVFSLIVGTLAAYLLAGRANSTGRLLPWLDPILVLPLGASAVTLGFGYLIAFGRPPLNWVASPALVPVVHALIAFPFVLRSVLPALRSIRPAIREVAAVLGSPPGRTWWSVDLPLIAPAMAVGAVFAFTISIGEFGATLLIVRSEYATIPVVLYRYLSQPGLANVGQALAMSTILMGICSIAFVAIERLRIGEVGGF